MPAGLAVFPLAFALSLLLVPLVRWLSFRFGRVSLPRQDRWHRKPTPTLGGVGMYLSFILAVLASAAWRGSLAGLNWSLLAASSLMFGLGLLDDFKRLNPTTKLVGQIVAAAGVIYFGRVIDFFPWGFANILLTFVWLVGITNAINLLDNMDGLAGGISLIASGFLAYFFWRAGAGTLLVMAVALAGSLLGFLVFNFPPAKIFMGDSGSLFIGFTLASLAVAHRPRASDVFTVMGVPVLLFLLPIVDTTLVTITRILRGQSPAQGGTDHTSHRLIAFGFNERQAVLALYLIGLLSGVAGSVLEALDYDLSLVLIPSLLILLSLLTGYLGRLKVVSTSAPMPSNFTRLMVSLTYKRRIFEMILDFILISVSYYLAFWTRYGFQVSELRLGLFLRSLPIALAAAYLSFFAFGIYRGIWQYIGLEDLVRFARAALGAGVLTALPLMAYYPDQYSAVLFFLFGVFLFLGLAAVRVSFRLLDRIYGEQQARTTGDRVLIVGADDAGEMALRWILRNPGLGYVPVGFLDDDPYKWGRTIHGVNVLGGRDQLDPLLERWQVDGIIVTAPGLLFENGLSPTLPAASEPDTGDGWLAPIRRRGLWVRLLRLDFELVE